ncbi:MAG: GNAT family N-acetyltransferase [Castellaniella sp.]
MATKPSPLPQHALNSLMAPRSLLVVADRALPAAGRLPRTLAQTSTFVMLDAQGGAELPSELSPARPGEPAGERLDLAVVCVPPARVIAVLRAVQAHRPRSLLLLRHPEAIDVPDAAALLQWGQHHDCRVLGPASFGVQRPPQGLNLSLDAYTAPQGRVALVTQSASLMAAVLDWAQDVDIGFSLLASVGDEADIDLADLVEYLSMDARTGSIVLYLESMPAARRFSSAVRAAASVKPVVVLKSGRHPADHAAHVQQQAAAHDAVFNALLRRAGAVRVRYFVQLFSALRVLEHVHRPRGRRIAIVSNGRAATRLALDSMGPNAAVFPASLARQTRQTLMGLSGISAQADQPVIVHPPLTPDVLERLLHEVAADTGVDGILVLIAPDPHADLPAVAERMVRVLPRLHKPVIPCFMGDAHMRELRRRLEHAGAPAFRTPESAVEGFGLLAAWHYSQTMAQQTLPPEPLAWPPRLQQARRLLHRVRNEHREALTDAECRELLECFYVPIDYHPDPGMVGLAAVSEVTPMAISVEHDATFGPVFAFGASRQVEWVAHSSRAVELPPLNRYLARQLVQRSTLWRRVLTRQLSPAGLEILHESLERLSDMVSELPTLQSIRIDPLYPGEPLLRAGRIEIRVRPQSLLVLPETSGYPHLAIHPYPRRLVQEQHFADGRPWLLRPIRPEDAEPLQEFVRGLSEQSRYMRFVSMLQELTPRMLARYTSIDYDRELALVATVSKPNPDHRGYPRETIIGFAHYLRNADGRGAEYALAIADDWQRHGLGARLMRALIDAAQSQGLTYIDGYVLAANRPMLGLMTYLGFRNDSVADDPGTRRVWLDLGEVGRQSSG